MVANAIRTARIGTRMRLIIRSIAVSFSSKTTSILDERYAAAYWRSCATHIPLASGYGAQLSTSRAGPSITLPQIEARVVPSATAGTHAATELVEPRRHDRDVELGRDRDQIYRATWSRSSCHLPSRSRRRARARPGHLRRRARSRRVRRRHDGGLDPPRAQTRVDQLARPGEAFGEARGRAHAPRSARRSRDRCRSSSMAVAAHRGPGDSSGRRRARRQMQAHRSAYETRVGQARRRPCARRRASRASARAPSPRACRACCATTSVPGRLDRAASRARNRGGPAAGRARVVTEDHVRCLDVAMDEPEAVRSRERVAQRLEDLEHLVRRQRAALVDHVAQSSGPSMYSSTRNGRPSSRAP